MITLKNAKVLIKDKFEKLDILIDNGKIIKLDKNINEGKVYDFKNKIIAPAFMDPHVHLREPGFEKKETIYCGSRAAARGGYTKIFSMPNLNPNPSRREALDLQLDIIKRDSIIDIYPIGSITIDNSGNNVLSHVDEIQNDVIGFSDDGKGVYHSNTMYEMMLLAKKYGKPIISHSEDRDLLYGGVITEGIYSEKNGFKGIVDIAETSELARNLVLAKKTGCHFHLCHTSCRDSVDLIRFYKAMGCHVTAEVTPHHLVLNEMDLKDDGNFKMNPPLMSIENQEALLEGLLDGTIDCIATDHAPHTEEEKSRGLNGSPFGIVGLETSFPLLYTKLVLNNKITLEQLLYKMSGAISDIFDVDSNEIRVGNDANIVVIDIEKEFTIDKNSFLSKGKNTPFDGWKVKGLINMTICKGEIVYEL